MATACGVTPQAQKGITRPDCDRVAEVRLRQIPNPMIAGSPTCTGEPCTPGYDR